MGPGGLVGPGRGQSGAKNSPVKVGWDRNIMALGLGLGLGWDLGFPSPGVVL